MMRFTACESLLAIWRLERIYNMYIFGGTMDARPNEISTFDDLLDRLGGKEQASVVLEATAGQVTIWKHRKRVASTRYHRHQEILVGKGILASPTIWGMEVRS